MLICSKFHKTMAHVPRMAGRRENRQQWGPLQGLSRSLRPTLSISSDLNCKFVENVAAFGPLASGDEALYVPASATAGRVANQTLLRKGKSACCTSFSIGFSMT
jgi:hypothetical protein